MPTDPRRPFTTMTTLDLFLIFVVASVGAGVCILVPLLILGMVVGR